MTDPLIRIADALDRLSPPTPPAADPLAHPAYVWRGDTLIAARDFAGLPLDQLRNIDLQKTALVDNLERLASGSAAHDALLWGARGTGKSATVASVVSKLQAEGQDIALLQCAIDELASLIFDAPGVKTKLVQLAQRGRAVGIHAIIATQRPEVRVIDGMIKAQFPSRVAFTVFGSRDSMIILDVGGAQKLLGQGDMLFKDVAKLHHVRVQGMYVQDNEIDRITEYWRSHPTT